MYKVSICTQRLHLHPLGAFFVYALNCIKIATAIDPACGSGGMFVQSAKFIQAHSGNRNNISVYGQEANADTWKMAKMNMAIRGIEADFGPHQADTFSNDLHKTLKADFILANPPIQLSSVGAGTLDRRCSLEIWCTTCK